MVGILLYFRAGYKYNVLTKMKKRNLFPLLAAGVVALASCNGPAKESSEATRVAAINPANMDTTVAPGTDFYRYACGG